MSDEPILLDTHCWVWMQFGMNHRFSGSSLASLRRASEESRLLFSVISVWEVALLESKGRLELWMDCAAWVQEALATPGLTLAPLTPEIAIQSTRLPGNLHGDPADRLIVATARAHGATLLTKDSKLLTYGRARHVSVLSA
jgi:PIN domain nuclease of toxin-antitoxin system